VNGFTTTKKQIALHIILLFYLLLGLFNASNRPDSFKERRMRIVEEYIKRMRGKI